MPWSQSQPSLFRDNLDRLHDACTLPLTRNLAVPMGSHTTVAKSRYVELDGMRALSVLAVFLFHITPAMTAISRIGWDPHVAIGRYTIRPPMTVAEYIVHLNVGVQIFFVLSGFLITSMFVRPHLEGRALPSGIGYAIRRATRVFPAYWLVLFVAGVTWFGLVESVDGTTVPMLRFPLPFGLWKHLTLTYMYFREQLIPGYGVNYGGLPVAWSLVVEITFYGFVPCWLLLCKAARAASSSRRLLIGALSCIPVGIVCGVVSAYGGEWAMRTPLGGVVSVFGNALISLGIGMALAVVAAAAHNDPDLSTKLRRLGERAGIWWAGAAMVYLVLAWPDSNYIDATSGELLWRQLVQPVVAGVLIAPFVLAPGAKSAIHRALRVRVLIWVGTISYGVYLWHILAINKMVVGRSLTEYNVLEASLLVTAMWLVTISLAAASWYFVERPLLNLAGRLGSRSNAVVAEAS